mmetsp:Transcript_20819/g.37086  ORF Transcript_20819/g.37086 Transcript_20819/m.37086 type:complete len:235 (-) Transcript_20819:547-1251(-)
MLPYYRCGGPTGQERLQAFVLDGADDPHVRNDVRAHRHGQNLLRRPAPRPNLLPHAAHGRTGGAHRVRCGARHGGHCVHPVQRGGRVFVEGVRFAADVSPVLWQHLRPRKRKANAYPLRIPRIQCAYGFLAARNANSSRVGRRVCAEERGEAECRRGVFRRRSGFRGRLSCGAEFRSDSQIAGSFLLQEQRVCDQHSDERTICWRRHRVPRPRLRNARCPRGRKRLFGSIRGSS